MVEFGHGDHDNNKKLSSLWINNITTSSSSTHIAHNTTFAAKLQKVDHESHRVRNITAYQSETNHRRGHHNTDKNNTHISTNTTATKLQVIRRKCSQIVTNDKFQTFILTLILLNSILMGIATLDIIFQHPKLEITIEWIDFIFLIVFTVEMIMHLVHRGNVKKVLDDGWLVFDVVVILMSWALATFEVIRTFRIVRATRLISRVKELRDIVLTLFNTTSHIFAIGLLLALCFYIFSILFTQLYQDYYINGVTDTDYFSHIDKTIFTLIQFMTLDKWSNATRQIMGSNGNGGCSWAWIPIIAFIALSFILVSSFVVVNLVKAVIHDVEGDTHHFHELEAEIVQVQSDLMEDAEAQIHAVGGKIDRLASLVERLAVKYHTE